MPSDPTRPASRRRLLAGTVVTALLIGGWIAAFAGYSIYRLTSTPSAIVDATKADRRRPATYSGSQPGKREKQAPLAPPDTRVLESIFGLSDPDYELCRRVVNCDPVVSSFPDPHRLCIDFLTSLRKKFSHLVPEFRRCVTGPACGDLSFLVCLEELADRTGFRRGGEPSN